MILALKDREQFRMGLAGESHCDLFVVQLVFVQHLGLEDAHHFFLYGTERMLFHNPQCPFCKTSIGADDVSGYSWNFARVSLYVHRLCERQAWRKQIGFCSIKKS